jgi:hypothetical protein
MEQLLIITTKLWVGPPLLRQMEVHKLLEFKYQSQDLATL